MLWNREELRSLMAEYLRSASWDELHELFAVALQQRGIRYGRARAQYRAEHSPTYAAQRLEPLLDEKTRGSRRQLHERLLEGAESEEELARARALCQWVDLRIYDEILNIGQSCRDCKRSVCYWQECNIHVGGSFYPW